jgi:hypothetical protein
MAKTLAAHQSAQVAFSRTEASLETERLEIVAKVEHLMFHLLAGTRQQVVAETTVV